MLYIETNSKDAAFHFSVEEYIMKHYPFDEHVMMIWQADKCAMLGNYQVAEAEIDMNYAEREKIQIVRRSSGGGTIFTDLGTLLYTVIEPFEIGTLPDMARENVAKSIVSALKEMDIQADIEGRNDISVAGKKVSGMAQYIRFGRLCTHGSILYNTNLDMLTRVLHADDEKIKSKALRSIRGRVTNIKEYMKSPCSTKDFQIQLKQILINLLSMKEHTLTDEDFNDIERIFAEKYGNPGWTFSKSPDFSFINSKRFAGGKVEVSLNISEGTITACSIKGDFLGVVPIDSLEKIFVGKKFQPGAFKNILTDIPLHYYLGNISKEDFLSCFS